MGFFHPQPVGLPGLVAFMLGFVLFIASFLRTRRGSGGGAPSARRSGLSTVGVAVQMLAFSLAGLGRIAISLPATSPAAILQAFAVAALMLLCVLMFDFAARAMGANWSVVARMREGHELVTSGIFARLRHPIYTGLAAFMIGMGVAFGHPANLVVAVPLYAIGTWIRVREEERLLRAQFGPAYDAYAARVKRFLPGII